MDRNTTKEMQVISDILFIQKYLPLAKIKQSSHLCMQSMQEFSFQSLRIEKVFSFFTVHQ